MKEGKEKSILVLARNDVAEAMRVAAGITIFGHTVELVFAHGILDITPKIEELAELVDLADIEPRSLYADPQVPQITPDELRQLVQDANFVINV